MLELSAIVEDVFEDNEKGDVEAKVRRDNAKAYKSI